jgi:hypothetical protein
MNTERIGETCDDLMLLIETFAYELNGLRGTAF